VHEEEEGTFDGKKLISPKYSIVGDPMREY
jgi:hypothetical protein